LGPGFDCIGLALDWWNTIEVETIARGLQIECVGETKVAIPCNRDNLIVHGMNAIFRRVHKGLPPLRIKMESNFPVARGLGSSSAAIVGGMVAANALLGDKFSIDELVTFATGIEGHPDNVAPALMGGLVAAAQEGKQVTAARFDVSHELLTVVFVPDQILLTKRARGVLPKRIPRADAIYNTSRTALWIAAIDQNRWDWLDIATQDRLHQPYRAKLVPGMDALFDAARRGGARGVALSGAGPSIIAFTERAGGNIALAMERAARRIGLGGVARVVRVSARGAWVELI
jgi:homoserine kinase